MEDVRVEIGEFGASQRRFDLFIETGEAVQAGGELVIQLVCGLFWEGVPGMFVPCAGRDAVSQLDETVDERVVWMSGNEFVEPIDKAHTVAFGRRQATHHFVDHFEIVHTAVEEIEYRPSGVVVRLGGERVEGASGDRFRRIV